MNKIKQLVAAAAVLAVLTVSASAEGYWGNPNKPVDSTRGTTNIVQNQVWPLWASNGSFTNVTPAVLSGPDAALQFTVNLHAANGAAVTNVVWHLGHSVMGGTPTNSAGTGLDIVWFDTVTNAVAASATYSTTTYSLTSGSGRNAAVAGAMGTIYVGWVDVPAGTTITNYSVAFRSR